MLQTKKQQWYDKTINWLLYSLAVGVPLVFSTAFYSNFAAPKLLFLRVVTLLVLLLWAWKSYTEEKIQLRRGKFVWALLLYAAVMVLATTTSSNIFSSLFGTETRFLGLFTQLNFLVVTWLVYNFFTTKQQIKTFITVMCFTGIVILTLYGFLQYFGVFNDSFAWSQSPQERVFGTMGHSDHFGAYLGMCILLSFGVIPFLKNKILQRFLVLCAHAAFIVLLLTGSRAALVATILSLVIVFVILAVRSKTLKLFLRKFWYVFVLGLAVIGGLIFAFREPLSNVPVIQRFEQGAVTAQQGYTPDRISWWYSSFAMLKDRPVLGFGLSTFRDIYNQYRRYDYRVPGPGDIQYQITPESSHDDYVDILATEGIVGFAAFAILLVIVFMGIDKKLFNKQKPDELFFMTLGMKGAIMVYLIQAVVNFGVVDTLTVFFLLLGAATGAVSFKEKNIELKLAPIFREFALCFVLILIIWGGFSTLHEAKAEYYYKNAIVEESAGRPENARNWYDAMITEQPYRYEYYQAYADFAFKAATASDIDPSYSEQYYQLALQNYQKATIINNFHPSTYYNMGVTSIQLAGLEQSDAYMQQGINDLQQAITLSPKNPLYAYQASKIFSQIGQTNLAVQALSDAVRVDPAFMDAQKILDQLQKKN